MNVSVITMLLLWAMLGTAALFPLSWLLQGGRMRSVDGVTEG